MVRTIEEIPNTGRDDLRIDDAFLMFYKTVLAFDHLRHQIHIISNLLVDESSDPIETQYEMAVAEISAIEALLRQPLELTDSPRKHGEPAVHSNFNKSDHLASIERRKNTPQETSSSRRFELELSVAPFDVYAHCVS
jgi:anthranilate synthase component 1